MNAPATAFPASASLPAGLVLLGLTGLLLLAFALGVLLARGLRPKPTQPAMGPSQVIESLPFPVALVDAHGRLLAWAPSASTWLEVPSPPRLAAPLQVLARHALHSQKPETAPITLEGNPPLRVQASPLTPEGHVLLFATPGGAESGANLTRLVAHELRTPLTAIVGHAEILSSCGPADEQVWRRSRDFIAAETQRLARLVDDLLTLARLEASPPLRQITNVRAVVESALATLYDRAEATHLSLTLDAPASLPRVRADGQRLGQAMINLLDNAIKYTPAGGSVTVGLVSEGGYVRVQISDTGPGIEPDDLPHLFEPLYRAAAVRSIPGTGLGLTIVRAILEQQGAPVSVHSRPGQGTQFTFRLPIAR